MFSIFLSDVKGTRKLSDNIINFKRGHELFWAETDNGEMKFYRGKFKSISGNKIFLESGLYNPAIPSCE